MSALIPNIASPPCDRMQAMQSEIDELRVALQTARETVNVSAEDHARAMNRIDGLEWHAFMAYASALHDALREVRAEQLKLNSFKT